MTPPAPYEVGQVLTVRCNSETIPLRIKYLQQPWTLSCGMVVEILDKSAEGETQTAFLKLYDWRFAEQLRQDQDVKPWTSETEREYADFVLSGHMEEFCHSLEEENIRETDDDWSAGQKEAFLALAALRMYRSETVVYERLGNFQGNLVPRCISTVVVDVAAEEQDAHDKYGEHFQIRGILLQHINGFNLSKLSSEAPSTSWQGIVDQAVGIVKVLGDNNILNADVRPDNFLVMRSVDSEEDYRVFMVDFGQSRLRREDESDFDWGRAKWRQDEEGAVGLVMQHELRKLGTEIKYEPSLRYLEFAEGEDDE